MCIQSIQRKKALCKLISATFLMNSVGLPSAFAAEEVAAASGTNAATAPSASTASSGMPASTDTSAGVPAGTASNTSASTTRDPKKAAAHANPSWAFHEDGTPLTAEELKALNYKSYYTDDEIKEINTYLDWFGYDWLIAHGFNVSLTTRSSNGSTYITIPHNKAQANSTTDNSATEGANSQTAVKCNGGYEMVNGTCVVKCASYEERDAGTKLCKAKACDAGKTLSSDGVCEDTVCPSDYTLDKDSGKCIADAATDKSAACATGLELVDGKCLTACADGKVRDTDGVCKAKKKDSSSVCQLAYQEWNADDKKCEDKVCKTGQTLDKSTGECKDNTTCPVGQMMSSSNTCTADACTQQGKETWKKPDGTAECVDKCASGTSLNAATGKCDAMTKTVTSCPSDSIKNQAEGRCDVCPDGQTPNADQTACVSTSSDSGSSKSKSKDALGTLAGLAGLFMMNRGGSDPSEVEGTVGGGFGGNVDQQKVQGMMNRGSGKADVTKNGKYTVINNVQTKFVVFAKEQDRNIFRPQDKDKAFVLTNEALGYKGTLHVWMSGYNKNSSLQAPESYFVVKSAPGQNFTYDSGRLPLIENFPSFYIPALANAGRYVVTCHLVYSNPAEDGSEQKPFLIQKSFPLAAVDHGSSLNHSEKEWLKETNIQLDESAYAIKATIASAVWENGVCNIKLKGGTIADDSQSAEIGDGTMVSSQNLDEPNCESINKEGLTINLTNTYIENDVLNDDGQMSVTDEEGNNVLLNAEDLLDSEDAQKYADELHSKVEDVTFGKDMPFGQKTEDGETKWVGYDGVELTQDQINDYGLEGASIDENGVVHDKDNNEIKFDEEKFKKAVHASMNVNKDMITHLSEAVSSATDNFISGVKTATGKVFGTLLGTNDLTGKAEDTDNESGKADEQNDTTEQQKDGEQRTNPSDGEISQGQKTGVANYVASAVQDASASAGLLQKVKKD